jgi:hypothetical protein
MGVGRWWVSLNSLSPCSPVIPAKAGIHTGEMHLTARIPAYAGMTGNEMLGRIQSEPLPLGHRGEDLSRCGLDPR